MVLVGLEINLTKFDPLVPTLARVGLSFLIVVVVVWALALFVQAARVENVVEVKLDCSTNVSDDSIQKAFRDFDLSISSREPQNLGVILRWTGASWLAPNAPRIREVLPQCAPRSVTSYSTSNFSELLTYLVPLCLLYTSPSPRD